MFSIDGFYLLLDLKPENKLKKKSESLSINIYKYLYLTESDKHTNSDIESQIYTILISGIYPKFNEMVDYFGITDMTTVVLIYDIYCLFNPKAKLDEVDVYKKQLQSVSRLKDEYVCLVCEYYLGDTVLVRNFLYRVDDFYKSSDKYLMAALNAFRAFYMI